jgi:hypothetical protein
LLHDFAFAFRNNENVKQKVARIREGGSHADMVQDLIELAVLGEKYPEPLAAIHFDAALLEQARTVSHTMSELLAAANGSAGEGGEVKNLRDKAYTLLAQKESTIREYGHRPDFRARYAEILDSIGPEAGLTLPPGLFLCHWRI